MAFIAGCLGFLLLILSDINDLKLRRAALKPLFFAGFALIAAAFALMCVRGFSLCGFPLWLRVVAGVIGLGSLYLLLRALFFALPFAEVYVSADRPTVCRSGLYALCRHPGVIFFFLFALCLWLSAGLPLWAAAAYSLLNLFYAAFQDIWIFPRSIAGYADYKKETPFLIPTVKSVRACLSDLRRG